MKNQLQTTIATVAISGVFLGMTACASKNPSENININTQPNATLENTNNTNIYPVAAVLKQAAINGFDEMLITEQDGMMDLDSLKMSMRIIIEPVDPNNPKMAEFKDHKLIEADTVSIFFFGGMPLMTEQGKTYYLPDSLINAGSATDKDDEYAIFTKKYAVPKSANIGESGKLVEGYDMGMADDGSKTPYTNTWLLNTTDNNHAKLCVNEKFGELAEGDTCYTINKTGDILDTDLKFSLSMEDGEPPMTFISE